MVAIAAGLATSGVFFLLTWSWINQPCGPGSPVGPGPAGESLNPISSQINSPTNLTLVIISTGTRETVVVSYTVKDTGGSYYSGTFNPQAVFCGYNVERAVNIVLTGQVVGQPFTFNQGNTHTVNIFTASHNQFLFTITA